MKEILLSDGRITQVSDEDFDYLNKFKWCDVNNKNYAGRSLNPGAEFMHHVVAKRMGLSLSHQIDHKDQNSLNNQRENLRSATQSQNMANRGMTCQNQSGFKGVIWHKQHRRWMAQIGYQGNRIKLDYFDSAIEAAKRYDHAAKRLFGEFAHLNFPSEVISATN